MPILTLNAKFNTLDSKGGSNISIYELLKNVDLNKIEKNKEQNELNDKTKFNEEIDLERKKKKKRYKAIDENFNQYLNNYFDKKSDL